jgi:2,4-dienoyl-CoA reductase-like NADH-dependent reductase (Old Yellow Enzyme family)
MNPIDSFKEACPISERRARNRFLAQPCEHNHARADGSFSEPLFDFYRRMKAGHWGVVVVETTATSLKEKCRERELVLTDAAENEESWKKFFHEMKQQEPVPKAEGDTLWILQITGAGHMNVSGSPRAVFKGQRELPDGSVLTTDEIETKLDEYVHATRLAYERGADGIDFKQCHRYFASLFLRPNNQREDEYGGSFENRTRFVVEYMARAKKEVGDNNFLWTTRVNGWDGGFPGGFGMAGPTVREEIDTNPQAWIRDSTEVERFYGLLDTLGFDLVNVSAGISIPSGRLNPTSNLHPNFYILQDLALHAKTYFRERQSRVVIACTGWSALGLHAFTIGSGYLEQGIDLIGFGRWQLCEPFLPKKVLDAPSDNAFDYLRSHVTFCLACSKCYGGLRGQGPVYCAMYE